MEFDASVVNYVLPVAGSSPADGRGRSDLPGTRVTSSGSGPAEQPRPLVGTAADAEAAAEELDQALAPHGVSLEFSRDADTGTIVIKLVDSASGEALRQIPNATALKLSAAFERLQGRLYSRHA